MSDAVAEAEPEIFTGSREQLFHLLAEAAEIEHTLMCSYLYAAFSLKRAGEPGVTQEQGEALERWRKAIIDVAVEEMGHLVIVANLTVAVGGRPHFGRPAFPVAPGYFPSGIAVRLTASGRRHWTTSSSSSALRASKVPTRRPLSRKTMSATRRDLA